MSPMTEAGVPAAMTSLNWAALPPSAGFAVIVTPLLAFFAVTTHSRPLGAMLATVLLDVAQVTPCAASSGVMAATSVIVLGPFR